MDNKAMNKLSYGLFVVTVRDGMKQNGCITNTAAQVTTDPNRISLTVNKANLTHDMIDKSGAFNVSILSEKASFDTFKHFGFQTGKEVDKFDGYTDMAKAENGIYYITAGTNAYLSAKVIDSIDLGTHTMFIADVQDAVVLNSDPSATYAYYHAHIKPKKKAAPTEGGKPVWVCKICGYVYEGDPIPADFICPLCKHPASDFERATQ